MDEITNYRLEQFEKRADAADARMARVEQKLNAIELSLASLAGSVATKDTIRNWGLAVAAVVVVTGAGVGAMMLQASGNQLAAFQSGLSAVQAIVAAAQTAPAHLAPKP